MAVCFMENLCNALSTRCVLCDLALRHGRAVVRSCVFRGNSAVICPWRVISSNPRLVDGSYAYIYLWTGKTRAGKTHMPLVCLVLMGRVLVPAWVASPIVGIRGGTSRERFKAAVAWTS